MTSLTAPRWIPGEAFYRALVFAVGLHRADSRKNATRDPYVSHLFSVCALVIEDGGSEEEAIAALLHDTVEDHGGRARLEQVRADFGETVARIVEGCSDRVDDDPPWAYRKQRYIERLKHEPADVRRVSLADKLHNARATIGDIDSGAKFAQDFNAKPGHQSWYYSQLLRAFNEAQTESRHLEAFRGAVERIVEAWPPETPPEIRSGTSAPGTPRR